MTEPSIFIAVTSYRGDIRRQCALSLLKLQEHLIVERKIRLHIHFLERTGIVHARNILASMFLASDYTHLLFVDDDMKFKPSAVTRELDSGKDVIGAACVARYLDLDILAKEAKTSTKDQAVARASAFNVKFSGAVPRSEPRDGLLRVAGIGMAVTLISRKCLEAMLGTGQIHASTSNKTIRPLYGFFDPVRVAGETLSEDLSFCVRYQQLCNGEVWAMVDEEIGHIGEMEFSAKYSDLH